MTTRAMVVAVVLAMAGGTAGAEPPTDSRAFRARSISAIICYSREKRAAALAEIKDEQDASRIAGVVDKRRLYAAQKEAHSAEKTIRSRQQYLKDEKLKAIPCPTPDVERLVACLRYEYDSQGEECTDPEWPRFLTDILRRDAQ